MKISFNSPKEKNPTKHEGIEVLYGPGKRVAYKLRWYMLMVLITSPIFMMAFKVLSTLLVVRAPGKIMVPHDEVFSTQSGIVEKVFRQKDDEVGEGEMLVKLINRDVLLKIETLKAYSEKLDTGTLAAQDQQLSLLRQRLAQAKKWFETTRAMKADGVLTRMEETQATEALLKSQTELIQAQIEFNATNQSNDQQRAAQELELTSLLSRASQLSINAPAQGTLVDLAVKPGQAVTVGESLGRIRTHALPSVRIYLRPEDARLAIVGDKMNIRLPSGREMTATIDATPQEAVKMPNEIREAFSSSPMGVVVNAKLDTPVESSEFIDQLPISASFPLTTQYWKHTIGL